MGTAERREREKQQRIEDILDAAEEVFMKKGFGAATMDDIAEAAELSKGTLYLYFKTKELIYLGIDCRGTSILCERFAEAVATETTGREQMRAIGRAYIRFAEEFPLYFQAMAYGERLYADNIESICGDPILEACQAKERENMEIMVGTLELGVKDGSVRKDIKPMEASISLWALSNGIIQMYTNRGRQIGFKNVGIESPDFLLEIFNDFIDRGLRP